MTTIKAFDDMMGQFLGELAQAFPDEPPKTAVNCQTFMKQIAQWVSQMTARDDAFFCDENEFAKSLNLPAIWKREDCSANTKQAIWQYFQSLYMIGTTLSMFPPETLSAIEAAAEKRRQRIEAARKAFQEKKRFHPNIFDHIDIFVCGDDPEVLF
mgnify:CR=1 FL=1